MFEIDDGRFGFAIVPKCFICSFLGFSIILMLELVDYVSIFCGLLYAMGPIFLDFNSR